MLETPPKSYQNDQAEVPRDLEKRYSFVKSLEVVKSAVSVIDVADLLCGPGGLRRVNTHWAGRCPLPDRVTIAMTPALALAP